MYEHHFVIEELYKQREKEMKKLMVETNITKKKPYIGYFPFLKQNNR
ncbi:MAG TPA: hypothetical protein VK190_06400 [Pseudoneobacillus sp.]|nr:hypothetical protein [Pseudoneobacillus sp.]